jgi:hypothetical protein
VCVCVCYDGQHILTILPITISIENIEIRDFLLRMTIT